MAIMVYHLSLLLLLMMAKPKAGEPMVTIIERMERWLGGANIGARHSSGFDS